MTIRSFLGLLKLDLSLRQVRLTSGLIIFTYVGLHLANHALGNISTDAMEAGLFYQKWLWQGMLGTLVLYAAFSVHFCLGLWALYERRHYGWNTGKVLQSVLGLLIPILLIAHLATTRLALSLDGAEKGYAQLLYGYFVKSPFYWNVQIALLFVAWCHGCLGVYYWLRLKPIFKHLSPLLTASAALLPVLALLGSIAAGQRIALASQDPAWRAANLAAAHVGTPAGLARLAEIRSIFLWCYCAAVLLVLAARALRPLWQRRHGLFYLTYADGAHGQSVQVPVGLSVLEASLNAKVPHAHVCGGRGRCSTCRIRVVGTAAPLPPASPAEQAVLLRVGATSGSRLACQLRPKADLAVALLLPTATIAADLRDQLKGIAGANVEERYVAVLVVEMWAANGTGGENLTLDSVFVIDRFIKIVGRAIAAQGGRPSLITGTGMQALFGLETPPETASAQAIRAVAAIGKAVSGFNELLGDEFGGAIRYGIGLHSGAAILGQVGFEKTTLLTAFGETPQLAARLQDLCRPNGVEAIVSEAVCLRSGFNLPMPQKIARPPGTEHSLPVRMVQSAAGEELSAAIARSAA